jgi:cobyrinic acid a,c-diamide synthase
MNAVPFKKGPDYIDPSWLKLASGNPVRNLDTYLMSVDDVLKSFKKNALNADISIIEGNRGLFDGIDSQGSHSTHTLARILKAPIIIVFHPKKVTRTAAAFILGCKMMAGNTAIAGVIINHAGGERHIEVVSRSIMEETGIPVIGAIPNYKSAELLPSRHLGLVTPQEHNDAKAAIKRSEKLVADNIDIDRIINISRSAEALQYYPEIVEQDSTDKVRIAYFYDRAFSFYYDDNLDALSDKGAELVKVSSIDDPAMPDVDALYIGGGFPETNLPELTANRGFINSLKDKIEEGLPVYAECGGLMYLCRSIQHDGEEFEMCGAIPATLKMETKPQGHGYCEAAVSQDNHWFPIGAKLRGHEFHYSRITSIEEDARFCLDMSRGNGITSGKEGFIYKNLFASYMHIHAGGCPEWSTALIQNAKRYKQRTKNLIN